MDNMNSRRPGVSFIGMVTLFSSTYTLDGKSGSGKSCLLVQLVNGAIEMGNDNTGPLVIYIPHSTEFYYI